MKPVCVKCQRFFRMVKSGFYFIEAMPRAGGDPRPLAGTAAPSSWTPYKIWVGDKWACEGCGSEILNGFGTSPISEHYRPDFAEITTRLGADQLQVNDC